MISVVIPTYNRAHSLPQAIHSVLQQTRAADEIIVVDDGSIDNTEQLIVQEFPHIRYYRQAHRGVSAARNFGIKMASHSWIALLDSDDQWLPNKLEYQREAIAADHDCVLCHCDEIWIRRGKRVNPMHKHKKRGGDIYRHCLPLCCISPSASLIRRDILIGLGLFDESLPACEDYDLWLRLCARYPVSYVDQALIVKYGGHDDQLSRQFWGMDRFRVQALLKMLQSRQLTQRQYQDTLTVFEEKCRILELGANKHDNRELLHELKHWRDGLADSGYHSA